MLWEDGGREKNWMWNRCQEMMNAAKALSGQSEMPFCVTMCQVREKERKDVLMFDSLLVLCHTESGSHTVSAVYHKTPVVRNHIKKFMEGTNIGTRISGCQSLKWNLALGIVSNPSSLPLLSPYLWPRLIFHCFQLHRHKKSFEYCYMNRKVLFLQHIMLKWLLLNAHVNLQVKLRPKDTMECLLKIGARSLWIQAYLTAESQGFEVLKSLNHVVCLSL